MRGQKKIIYQNKDKTIITEEDNYNKNILLRTEEFKNGINKLKEEFELSGYKPNINRAKNLLNLNSNSRTINVNSNSKTLNLNKPINFQNIKLMANINIISNDFKTNTLYKYRNFIYYSNINITKTKLIHEKTSISLKYITATEGMKNTPTQSEGDPESNDIIIRNNNNISLIKSISIQNLRIII